MKKKLSCLIIMLITFLFLSETCRAEPDSTINYLMNEPVSMLDWGLFHLEKYMTESRHSGRYTVNYHPDKNRIYIKYTVGFNEKLIGVWWAKDRCKGELITIRAFANSLAFNDSFTHSLMLHKFKHEPEDLAEKLMKITEITVESFYKEDANKRSLRCSGPLLGDDINFAEPELYKGPLTFEDVPKKRKD